jgi:hypothetical protein
MKELVETIKKEFKRLEERDVEVIIGNKAKNRLG